MTEVEVIIVVMMAGQAVLNILFIRTIGKVKATADECKKAIDEAVECI